MFFRIKKIKGKEYTYSVENEWSRKGSRQKVKGYIGRAYRFELKNDIGFLQHLGLQNAGEFIESNDFRKIVASLVEWELFKFDIDKSQFSIDFENSKVEKKRRNAVIMINDGYLCSETLKNLIEFRPENEEQNGYRLARAFVEAGIKVPQEIFIGLFNKLYKAREKEGDEFTW